MVRDFKFKDVEVVFDMKRLPHYDQEYLRTMSFETVGNRSVKHSGRSFPLYYKNPGNYTLFNDEHLMINYMSEFTGQFASTCSHLLNGKKYWFAWTFNK
tara:strand:+ start:198 stop:494 length:297 start_codon:yes stop_codon:yes gene_type:complete